MPAWFYVDDQQGVQPCAPAVSSELETFYVKVHSSTDPNVKSSFDLRIGGSNYSVDVVLMEQYNVSTRRYRSLFRRPCPAGIAWEFDATSVPPELLAKLVAQPARRAPPGTVASPFKALNSYLGSVVEFYHDRRRSSLHPNFSQVPRTNIPALDGIEGHLDLVANTLTVKSFGGLVSAVCALRRVALQVTSPATATVGEDQEDDNEVEDRPPVPQATRKRGRDEAAVGDAAPIPSPPQQQQLATAPSSIPATLLDTTPEDTPIKQPPAHPLRGPGISPVAQTHADTDTDDDAPPPPSIPKRGPGISHQENDAAAVPKRGPGWSEPSQKVNASIPSPVGAGAESLAVDTETDDDNDDAPPPAPTSKRGPGISHAVAPVVPDAAAPKRGPGYTSASAADSSSPAIPAHSPGYTSHAVEAPAKRGPGLSQNADETANKRGPGHSAPTNQVAAHVHDDADTDDDAPPPAASQRAAALITKIPQAIPAAMYTPPVLGRLVFPSISTAVFMFDLNSAASVACGVIANFLKKRPVSAFPWIQLCLIDAPRGPDTETVACFKKVWASVCPPGETRFSMITADVTKVNERLPAGFIGNASNASFNGGPSTGGFNRALYVAAGDKDLQADTRAKYPKGGSVGPCYEIALRQSSPLYQEGTRYVLHVIGPNMNPTRPNCLNGDYKSGKEQLTDCYTNLLETYFALAYPLLSTGSPA